MIQIIIRSNIKTLNKVVIKKEKMVEIVIFGVNIPKMNDPSLSFSTFFLDKNKKRIINIFSRHEECGLSWVSKKHFQKEGSLLLYLYNSIDQIRMYLGRPFAEINSPILRTGPTPSIIYYYSFNMIVIFYQLKPSCSTSISLLSSPSSFSSLTF